MTDELDPKLREFEAKLRRLKPLKPGIALCYIPGSLFSRYAYDSLKLLLPLTAASLLVSVWFFMPDVVKNEAEIPLEVAVVEMMKPPRSISPPVFPTVWQMSIEILEEIQPATPRKMVPDYPVIELTVADVRGDRSQETGDWLDFLTPRTSLSAIGFEPLIINY